MTTPLSGNPLASVRVGVSVSVSPDLGRLGLFESHFRLALAEITRTVVLAGGDLIYGGHLRADGYTAFMLTELQRYTRRNRPLLVCLAWHLHREMPLADLERFRHELGLLGRLVCLDPTGAEVDPAEGRTDVPVPVGDPSIRSQSLTAMRQYMRDREGARVLIGGRREGSGRLPGLIEEAILALEAGHPIYLAGGFGGAAFDIARALGVDDGSWLPPMDPPDRSAEFTDGHAKLAALAASPGWDGLDNGLSKEENRRLAATHRPSEVATLVGLGLGRHSRRSSD
jgi:hypothetical protein